MGKEEERRMNIIDQSTSTKPYADCSMEGISFSPHNHTWGVVGVAVGLFIHLASIYKPLLGSKYRTKCWKYSRAQNKELIVNE